jgi:hypothetical protein
MHEQVFDEKLEVPRLHSQQLSANTLNAFDVLLFPMGVVDNFVVIYVVDGLEPRRHQDFVRVGRIPCDRYECLLLVNLEFEKPYLADLALRVKLCVWIVAKVFKKSQISPVPWTNSPVR